MNKKLQISVAACILAASQSLFAESFVLSDIQVQGLNNVPVGTVLSKIPVKPGQNFDERQSQTIVDQLFKTGLFSDVQLLRRDNVLVVQVQESTLIGAVNIKGNHMIETPALQAAIYKMGIKPGRTANPAALKQLEKDLKQQYVSMGRYNAQVRVSTKPAAGNRSAVHVDINEGQTSKISRINITGNHAFTDAQLLKQMSSGTRGGMFSSSNEFSKEKLINDVKALREFYLNQGYLRFKVLSSKASMTPDGRSSQLNLHIHEGQQYRVGKIRVNGNGMTQEQAKRLVSLREGQMFTSTGLEKTKKALAAEAAKGGFANARIKLDPQVDEANRVVNLNFNAQQGSRVYVRRINIRGNYRTEDQVFRREMRQLESEPFSKSALRQSQKRIQRLPFVESVSINTSPVAGRGDQIDVDVLVKERSSNQFTAGLGYSQSNGLLFNVGLKQNNFMGTGKELSVGASRSASTKKLDVSYFNPYFTDSGIGRGFSVYYKDTDADEEDISSYLTNVLGGKMNFSYPLGEDQALRFGVGAEQREIITSSSSPAYIDDFVNKNSNKYTQYKADLSYVHDNRDNSLFPTEGTRYSVGLETALPGSDLQYGKLRVKGATYHKVTEDIVFSARGGLGYGKSFGDTEELPFFENFTSGGISTVRGFENNSLGPKDENGDSKGGAYSVNGSMALQTKVPFLEDVKGLRMSAFVDTGSVFEDADAFDVDEMRASAGLGVTWMSPMGPFTLSYAEPLNAKDGDDTQTVQFSIGSSF